ncbi:MAG: response regulator [Kofleriaceae bacterium]
MRILFVDDDPLVLSALSMALKPEESPWEMVFALGGEVGLSHLQAETYDVLVAELRMANIDGVALFRFARDHCPSTVRVALSAWIYPGLDAHIALSKPCKLSDLRVALADIATYVRPS